MFVRVEMYFSFGADKMTSVKRLTYYRRSDVDSRKSVVSCEDSFLNIEMEVAEISVKTFVCAH
jgi:hypothetical protein